MSPVPHMVSSSNLKLIWFGHVKLGSVSLTCTIFLLWCWWSVPNKVNAREGKKDSHVVTNDVHFHQQAWNVVMNNLTQSNNTVSRVRWKAPPELFYKINYDGAFIPDGGNEGWVVLGLVVAAGADKADNLTSSKHAEALACLKVIMESDTETGD